MSFSSASDEALSNPDCSKLFYIPFSLQLYFQQLYSQDNNENDESIIILGWILVFLGFIGVLAKLLGIFCIKDQLKHPNVFYISQLSLSQFICLISSAAATRITTIQEYQATQVILYISLSSITFQYALISYKHLRNCQNGDFTEDKKWKLIYIMVCWLIPTIQGIIVYFVTTEILNNNTTIKSNSNILQAGGWILRLSSLGFPYIATISCLLIAKFNKKYESSMQLYLYGLVFLSGWFLDIIGMIIMIFASAFQFSTGILGAICAGIIYITPLADGIIFILISKQPQSKQFMNLEIQANIEKQNLNPNIMNDFGKFEHSKHNFIQDF